MEIEQTLEKLGLNKNESKIYLALLELGQATILQLARQTGLKRPTIYLIIDSLLKKNLIHALPKEKKMLYFPENPQQLLIRLQETTNELQSILPDLQSLFSQEKERPRLTFYEGREGVKKVYDLIRQSKKEILFYGSFQAVKEEFLESTLKFDELSRKKDFVGMREIVNNLKFDKEFAQKINIQENQKHKVKILPGNWLFTDCDNAIFDNKLAIFSIKRDYFVVVLESQNIADCYRAMFEMAWKIAKIPKSD